MIFFNYYFQFHIHFNWCFTGTNSLQLCNFLVIIFDIQYLFFFFYELLFSQQFQLVRVWKFCSTGRNHFWVLLVVEEEFRWIPQMSSYIRCCCASNQFEFRIWALDHEQRKKIKTVLLTIYRPHRTCGQGAIPPLWPLRYIRSKYTWKSVVPASIFQADVQSRL